MPEFLSIMRRIHVIGSERGEKKCYDFRYDSETLFPAQFVLD